MKIRSVGVELFHKDRQTDITYLIAAFHNFVKASKNWNVKVQSVPKCSVPTHTFLALWYSEFALSRAHFVKHVIFVTVVSSRYVITTPRVTILPAYGYHGYYWLP